MLEVTGEDVAALNDGDLRSLVALLCESELRRRGLPISGVTAGGNQDAADGGVDVRVALPAGTAIEGFVPRGNTVFQVKVSDMPRSAILAEMMPFGTIRPAIQELANLSGAYIIVSSAGSTSDSALRRRRAAVAEAIDSLPNAGSLALDFYDRNRLATWIRNHPGLIPWVRQHSGKGSQGWQSYGAWAYAPEGVAGEYLLDDSLRVRTAAKDSGDGLGVVAGINRIRGLLREPGRVIRLVGLSGVGKTRLVQALFDERVGEDPLDPSIAIYTNLADGPQPQPVGLASDLIASRSRNILVVDNCPPDLHRRLSELCRSPGSLLGVLTVEYDIRDDQQEGTEVFKLEPSSKALIEKLIRRRFQDVSPIDVGTIAEFSGGNARVAMALAATVGKNETIAGLKDEDLFHRLFQQGHQHDDELLRIAQACALVYSFEGEATSGAEAELPRLSALIGKSAEDVFRGVAELQRRDLAQKRNVWRAVLPHAIANRLAMLALQNIPVSTIEAQLITGAPDRLAKSFCRRLGYLDGSKEAIGIVERWLARDGLLGDVAKLDDLGVAMFKNVVPVAPAAALGALERTILGAADATACKPFAGLLRSLAYEPELFERSTNLLVRLAEGEDEDSGNNLRNMFASLFPIHLSGTHATIEQRLALIKTLLGSDSPRQQALGLSALRNVLETGPFNSSFDFEFGARSRDHGYWPQTQEDIRHWFGSALALGEALGSSGPVTSEVRPLLAGSFRGLWNVGMLDELERVFRKMAQTGFWREGWIAVRQTQVYDAKAMAPEEAQRLAELEKCLRPQRLPDRMRAIVLSRKSGGVDLDDWDDEKEDITASFQRRAALVYELGQQMAQDKGGFEEVLPELITSGSRQVFEFGQGLATGAETPGEIWKRLVVEFAKSSAKSNDLVLRGFLNGLRQRDALASEAVLDEALADNTLAPLLPILQTAVPIDQAGVRRIKESLAGGRAPAENYRILAWGRANDSIPAPDLRDILLSISEADGGLNVACDILYMHMHSDREKKAGSAPELLETGRILLSKLEFKDKKDREDNTLKEIAKACLRGKEGGETARAICQRLRAAIAANETSALCHADFLSALFAAQPLASLDGLLGGDAQEQKRGMEVISRMRLQRRNPLDVLPDEELIEWCDSAPATRFATAGSVISISQQPEGCAATEWSPTVLKLLKNTPSRVEFLKRIVTQMRPMIWRGSRAVILESNAKLLDQLSTFPDPAVVEFVRAEKRRLAEEVDRERRFEAERDRNRDERFE